MIIIYLYDWQNYGNGVLKTFYNIYFIILWLINGLPRLKIGKVLLKFEFLKNFWKPMYYVVLL